MAETPLVFEIATFAVLAVFFVVDLFIIGRKPHVPSTKAVSYTHLTLPTKA